MFIPTNTVDRKRGFLSSMGMERSQLYLLAGFIMALFLLLSILGSEQNSESTTEAVPSVEPEVSSKEPAITVGGMLEKEPGT